MSNPNHPTPSYGTKVSLHQPHCILSLSPLLTQYDVQVDLGQNAPVTREGAGVVPDNSLAAESYARDGDFAANRGAKPDEGYSTAKDTYSNVGRPPVPPQGETAPSYVLNQYNQASGPHGKNITESNDLDGRDGLKRALQSEPGSKNDPSRMAEQKFQLQQNSVGRSGGPKEAADETVNPYDTLNSNVST